MSRPGNEVQPITVRTKWRDDFPVDEPWYHYISRREFTKFLVMISGAFAIGQLWIGFQNLRRRFVTVHPVMKIADINSIEVGESRAFFYPGEHDRCLLIRTAEDTFVAYNDKCTHLMCPVVPKMAEQQLVCPCHRGIFDMASGRPIAGPPDRPLERVSLRIENGAIYAIGMEKPKV